MTQKIPDFCDRVKAAVEKYHAAEYRRVESQMSPRTPDAVYTARLYRLEEKEKADMEIIDKFKNLMIKYNINEEI